MSKSAPPSLLRAARVRRPHGVNGGVRALNLGDDPKRFKRGVKLEVEETGEQLTVKSAIDSGDGDVILQFEEIASPDAAERLRNRYLCVDPGHARKLRKNEWFVWQLIGMHAVTSQGKQLGEVVDVEPGSAHDFIVVKSAGGDERRFPMVAAFVENVDTAAGRIVITQWEEA